MAKENNGHSTADTATGRDRGPIERMRDPDQFQRSPEKSIRARVSVSVQFAHARRRLLKIAASRPGQTMRNHGKHGISRKWKSCNKSTFCAAFVEQEKARSCNV